MAIKVLLVDDHQVVRDGLQALLEMENDIEVIGAAGDGEEAVKKALILKPDIVIMDIAMPVHDGVEAVRRLRQRAPDIRVIILSMYISSEYVYRTLRAGAKGYILKESAGEQVVKAVRIVYEGSRFLSPKIAETVITTYIEEDAVNGPLESLSQREYGVLRLVVEGSSSISIAQSLSLSPKTVDTYRSRIMQKLGLRNKTELIKFAMRHGLAN